MGSSQVDTENYWQDIKPDDYEDENDYTTHPLDKSASPCMSDDVYSFGRSYYPVVYGLVFVLAIVGNILVLVVVGRFRCSASNRSHALSLTDIFLLHLAMADLLLALSLPLAAVQWADQWVFGPALCKISGGLFSLNRFSGILFLACISFDRYLAIVHAVRSGWKHTTYHGWLVCALIWVICMGLSGVEMTFRQVSEVGPQGQLMCQNWYPQNTRQWQVGLQLISMVLGFILPLLVMLYCYVRIFRSLCNAPRRQKRKSLRLIVTLVSVFILCWAPFNFFRLADSLEKLGVIQSSCQFFQVVDFGTMVTETVGLSHCALNPLLYAFVGVKFRRELAKMVRELLGPRSWTCREDWGTRKTRRITGSFSSAESENTSHSVMV